MSSTTKEPAYFEELLSRARAADSSALEALYTELYTPIYRYVYARLGAYPAQKQLAEDITQEAFLKLFTNIRAGKMDDFKGTLVGYSFTIARNLIIDYSRKKRESLLTTDEESFDDLPSDQISQEEEAHIKLVGSEIFKHIAELPDSMQEVLILSFVHEYSSEEISAVLSKSEEAVRQLKSRGLRKLRYIMRGQQDSV
jgi:RNA polymerase sigma-70 factor (ECF subfamily)